MVRVAVRAEATGPRACKFHPLAFDGNRFKVRSVVCLFVLYFWKKMVAAYFFAAYGCSLSERFIITDTGQQTRRYSAPIV